MGGEAASVPSGDADQAEEVLRGPHGWLNWRAEREGRPRRADSHVAGTNQVLPVWAEHALYSDAYIRGQLRLGPHEFFITIPGSSAQVGLARLQVVFRWYDHLPDPDPGSIDWDAEDIEDYYGGDIGDEFAALLALALGRRLRSGGITRRGYAEADPAGSPSETEHRPPALIPPDGRPLLPGVVESPALEEAEPLLRLYLDLELEDAVALVRAASQYADALWIADADPRVAWIKLVGAVETAANRWDAAGDESPLDRLKRHRAKLYESLEGCPDEVKAAVANDIAHTFKVVAKFKDFIQAFDPGPPVQRPDIAQFDWSQLDRALGVIYDWRSRDLHDGIPFPAPLCNPPQNDEHGHPVETFPGLAVGSQGGVWPAERLPMHLHLFAHIARGCLRNWWESLGQS